MLRGFDPEDGVGVGGQRRDLKKFSKPSKFQKEDGDVEQTNGDLEQET